MNRLVCVCVCVYVCVLGVRFECVYVRGGQGEVLGDEGSEGSALVLQGFKLICSLALRSRQSTSI